MLSKKILLVLLVVGFSLFFAWSRIHVVELGYEVSRLKGETEKAKQENGGLKSALAQALSAEKLSSLAKRLGMGEPEAGEIIFVPER